MSSRGTSVRPRRPLDCPRRAHCRSVRTGPVSGWSRRRRPARSAEPCRGMLHVALTDLSSYAARSARSMAVQTGTQAPEFTLPDQNKQSVALSSFRGQKNVLLVFYPFAFSPVCTNELRQVRDELPRYQNENVQILAVSTDPTFSLKAFAVAEGYEFPLLSDFWP